MTKRERLHPEIKHLREEGLTFAEIGERFGISGKTAHDYHSDPTGEKRAKRVQRYRAKDFRPCPQCGATTHGSTVRSGSVCVACHRQRAKAAAQARLEAVAEMYRSGMSLREIAAALGYGPTSNPGIVTEARRRGLITNYRYKAHENGGVGGTEKTPEQLLREQVEMREACRRRHPEWFK